MNLNFWGELFFSETETKSITVGRRDQWFSATQKHEAYK
jgi:hypothetical protein